MERPTLIDLQTALSPEKYLNLRDSALWFE